MDDAALRVDMQKLACLSYSIGESQGEIRNVLASILSEGSLRIDSSLPCYQAERERLRIALETHDFDKINFSRSDIYKSYLADAQVVIAQISDSALDINPVSPIISPIQDRR